MEHNVSINSWEHFVRTIMFSYLFMYNKIVKETDISLLCLYHNATKNKTTKKLRAINPILKSDSTDTPKMKYT